MDRIYACIDLKSFYASVECHERNLNPLDTNLVVADSERTEKTICLAVSPSLKSYGLSGRCRLYEVIEKVKEVNNLRRKNNNYKRFISSSYIDSEVKNNKDLALDFIMATPRMKLYMKYSVKIYNIYLKYISSDDIFAYSIDEVFCDLTSYLNLYKLTPEKLITKMIKDVYDETGITATAGIGTNMYLAKIAMDIEAKHMEANSFGVRVAFLNEELYKKNLWNHLPLTDFWRIGSGTVKRLNDNKMYTMGDVARMSIVNEDKLFKIFGINAELLIDHAWGYEPCTISDVKKYHSEEKSISRGQVLSNPYDYRQAKLIVREMTDLLVLDLVKKNYLTNRINLDIGYDVGNIKNGYKGITDTDRYGRVIPKPSHGTKRLSHLTSSTRFITKEMMLLYDEIININLMVRRITVTFNVKDEKEKEKNISYQFNLFDNYDRQDEINKEEILDEKEEKEVQKAIINIHNKYGKNSILKGMNYEKDATTRERNREVGGHRG